jgi:hypothetical protein
MFGAPAMAIVNAQRATFLEPRRRAASWTELTLAAKPK